MRIKHGFTLVEILIVVVILGILAAIVIPQFSDASTQAKENSVKADLQTIRSQIELFKVQHTDVLPGSVSGTTFVAAMTGITNVAGATAASGYGPYLLAIPVNPFKDLATVTEVAADGTGANVAGWHYNNTSGKFQADDDAVHALW